MASNKIYLGLGSNLGDRLAHLERAVELMDGLPQTRVCALSSVYETQPRLYTAQPNFLNACARLQTQLEPTELLLGLQRIEAVLGRKRDIVNGPRTIDLDILLFGQKVIARENLNIPHPQMHKRSFVLVPLDELMNVSDPDWHHPQLDQSLAELVESCPDAGWVRVFTSFRYLHKTS